MFWAMLVAAIIWIILDEFKTGVRTLPDPDFDPPKQRTAGGEKNGKEK